MHSANGDQSATAEYNLNFGDQDRLEYLSAPAAKIVAMRKLRSSGTRL